jgi:SAM-dependent MidA family methyltransferase
MILANELLDAFSVHLVTARDGELRELYVRSTGNSMMLESGPPSTPLLGRYLASIGVTVPDGVQWEVNLNAVRWVRQACRSLAAGALLLVDYGYVASDLYSPLRPGGTLLCYAGHTVHSDPLRSPGEQDITSHVDLTSVRAALAASGLRIAEDRPQAEALGAHALSEWRSWTLGAGGPWDQCAGLARSLDALAEPAGLGRLQWILSLKAVEPQLRPSRPPLPSSARLLRDHLELPDPAALDPISDVEAQWRELWEDDDS